MTGSPLDDRLRSRVGPDPGEVDRLAGRLRALRTGGPDQGPGPGPVPTPDGGRRSADFWWYDELGSTNDRLRELAAAGAPDGTVVLAGRQTAGRGRHGRTWHSPDGGLYLSLLLRPDLDPARGGWVTLAAALAVVRRVGSLGAEARIKWPNDVLCGDRKLAGILAEAALEGGRIAQLVVGIGVNLSWEGEVPAGLRDRAVALSELVSAPFDVDRLTAGLLVESLDLVAGLSSGTGIRGDGSPEFAGEAEERLYRRGRPVTLRVGVEVATGVCAGLGPECHLRLEDGRSLAAGELIVWDPEGGA
jgi:biotin-[acetyl-CoA-carboxylase] ligase BirA-like protein